MAAPWITRISSNRIGASMPICSYVGSNPMISVGTAIMKMLKVNIFLRPSRSPKCAMTMPPNGRARYPAAKIPKVCINRSHSGMSAGKNSLPTTVAKNTKIMKS